MGSDMCERCGQNPATVHVTYVVNGSKSEHLLCEACAKQEGHWPGMAVPGHLVVPVGSLLGGLLPSAKPQGTPDWARVQCSQCGWTPGQFQETGRLGCDRCYESFAPLLGPLVQRIHGSGEHRGKIPARAGSTLKALRELEALRDQLRDAVQREEFETAAALRDRIRELERSQETAHGQD